MFVLREAHLAAFALAAREAFEDRMIARFAARFPDQCAELGPVGLLRHVTASIERTRGYGITTERDVAAFLRMTFFLGFDFDLRAPWASVILTDRSAPASARLQSLADAARANRAARPGRPAGQNQAQAA